MKMKNDLGKDNWDFCKTDDEALERYGQETYDCLGKVIEAQDKRIALRLKRLKTLWGQFQNCRTSRKELNVAINFIMHGPGGD